MKTKEKACWPVGGGEMGALMRSTDWSKTKLGPIEDWPKSLRTMLGVILGSRFPMLIWWGPEMLHLYNDAYRPILRDKHPASLAAPAAEVWAEIWDVAGPMARGVLGGGPATWTEDLQLFINNAGISEETYFTFSYSPIPGDDGRVGGLLNTVQETTAKVQSERQIRMLQDLTARAVEAKSEDEAYRIAMEVLSTNDMDLPFTLLYAIPEKGGARLVGKSGRKGDAGTATHAADWPLEDIIQTSREMIVDDRAILLPLSHPGQSAPYAVLVAGISPHRTLDDRYKGFFRIVADQVGAVITAAKAHEMETRRAEALAQIDRAKTAFFSNVSHEFRTPLTLMLGPIEDELAEKNSPLPEARRKRLETAHHNSLRLLKLVNALLDFSRIEAGRVEAHFEPTDLAAFTAELASVFRSAAEKANLTLTVNCPSLPEPVYIDREMWEKIVLNLLSNAFKHTFDGGIQIALQWCGDHVELAVKDSGIGISESELPRVFERFHRVKGARSRTHEGTGIGLALVQELVSLHGGLVAVDSREDQGTTFKVMIKAGHAHLPAERVGKERPVASTPNQTAAYVEEALRWLPDNESLQKERPTSALKNDAPSDPRAHVLVADDNADLRRYVAGLLDPYYEVEAVADGQLALEAIRERKPDLVVSDIMMPNLDGLGLLQNIRENTETRTIPVILLSARAGEESTIAGLEAGADDYLAKPFSAQELLARVRTHLELAQVRRQWAQELEATNKELESFSYSVSHDLRAPLRAIDGFTRLVLEGSGTSLKPPARKNFEKVRQASLRMGELIEDLLKLSQVTRHSLVPQEMDLSACIQTLAVELRGVYKHPVKLDVQPGVTATADRGLLTIALQNLLSNAWKFTAKTPNAKITFGVQENTTPRTFYIRDNGAGFDMEYAIHLFGPFQRMHSMEEFPGTGIGLSIVKRIIHRHGGTLRAEAKINHGATFYFTLKDDA